MATANPTNPRSGRLVFVSVSDRKEKRGIYFNCLCDCGARVTVRSDHFGKAAIKSCGCLRRDTIASIGRGTKTHGGSRSAEYQIWVSMIRRCHDKKNCNYRLYGARGITVCERWRESFQAFMDDMGKRPEGVYPSGRSRLSIDRFPNNDGDYEPGNCRWAVGLQQGNNKRTNVFLSFDGKNLTLMEWSRVLKMAHPTLRARIRSGWSVERALTEATDVRRRRKS